MEYVRSTLSPGVLPVAAVEEMDDRNAVVVAGSQSSWPTYLACVFCTFNPCGISTC